MPKTETRQFPLTIRFRATHVTARELGKLAEFYERSESDVLRRILRKAYLQMKRMKALARARRATKSHAVAPEENEG